MVIALGLIRVPAAAAFSLSVSYGFVVLMRRNATCGGERGDRALLAGINGAVANV
jgi:hypothetical protein